MKCIKTTQPIPPSLSTTPTCAHTHMHPLPRSFTHIKNSGVYAGNTGNTHRNTHHVLINGKVDVALWCLPRVCTCISVMCTLMYKARLKSSCGAVHTKIQHSPQLQRVPEQGPPQPGQTLHTMAIRVRGWAEGPLIICIVMLSHQRIKTFILQFVSSLMRKTTVINPVSPKKMKQPHSVRLFTYTHTVKL